MPTWYMTNTLLDGIWQEMSETSPGADASSSPATGWTQGTAIAAGNRTSLDAQSQIAMVAGGLTQPDGSLVTTAGAGDALRTSVPYTGTFATGNWVLTLAMIGSLANGAGRVCFRLLSSPSATAASGVTLITASQILAGSNTSHATSQFTNTATAASLAGFTVSNEYIFCQIAYEVGTQSTMSTNVTMRIGTTATRLVSATFTPAATPSIVVPSPSQLQQILIRS